MSSSGFACVGPPPAEISTAWEESVNLPAIEDTFSVANGGRRVLRSFKCNQLRASRESLIRCRTNCIFMHGAGEAPADLQAVLVLIY